MSKQDDGAKQTYCQAGIEPHYYASRSVPDSELVGWVRICMTCGHIDGKDLDDEVRKTAVAKAEVLRAIGRDDIMAFGDPLTARNELRQRIKQALGLTSKETKE